MRVTNLRSPGSSQAGNCVSFITGDRWGPSSEPTPWLKGSTTWHPNDPKGHDLARSTHEIRPMIANAKTGLYSPDSAKTGNCISSSIIYGLHLVNWYYGLTQNLTACLKSYMGSSQPGPIHWEMETKPGHSQPGSPSSKRKPEVTTVSTGSRWARSRKWRRRTGPPPRPRMAPPLLHLPARLKTLQTGADGSGGIRNPTPGKVIERRKIPNEYEYYVHYTECEPVFCSRPFTSMFVSTLDYI